MLTNTYYENYLRDFNKKNDRGQVVVNIMSAEKETGLEILNWGEDQFKVFLKISNPISISGVYKSMWILKGFSDYICKEENIKNVNYKLEKHAMEYINRNKLKESTLTYEQYIDIKNQLNVTNENGNRINVRNSVILELAWEGLSSNEMKNLKINDIEFIKNENSSFVILSTEERIVRVDNSETIEDIKLCMKETTQISIDKNGKKGIYNYVDSDYLLRPIKRGNCSNDGMIKNVIATFHSMLNSNNIICQGIDIEGLTLDDVKRSKMIFLLSPGNIDCFDIKTVMAMFNLEHEQGVYWIKTFAEEIYKK